MGIKTDLDAEVFGKRVVTFGRFTVGPGAPCAVAAFAVPPRSADEGIINGLGGVPLGPMARISVGSATSVPFVLNLQAESGALCRRTTREGSHAVTSASAARRA